MLPTDPHDLDALTMTQLMDLAREVENSLDAINPHSRLRYSDTTYVRGLLAKRAAIRARMEQLRDHPPGTAHATSH